MSENIHDFVARPVSAFICSYFSFKRRLKKRKVLNLIQVIQAIRVIQVIQIRQVHHAPAQPALVYQQKNPKRRFGSEFNFFSQIS